MTTSTGRLSARMAAVSVSPTMQVAAEADRLRRSGVDVVDLGAGEPDFRTPVHITEAAHAAIDAGFTKYTANPGTADLRAAVAESYRSLYGVAYAPEEVIITAGGKQALYHAAMALFGPGDDVITHTPGWPTLVEQIALAGATPVQVSTSEAEGFALTAERLLSAVTPRTRGIVINSPGNPTGALLEEAEAARLAQEAARLGLWIVLDLCYEQLIYPRTAGDPAGSSGHNLPAVMGDVLRDRLVVCGSTSKTYAMTGWRCGWLIGPRDVVQAANALQSHQTSNVSSIAQKAAFAALTGPQACVGAMRDEYRSRRDEVLRWLAADPEVSCVTPRGAFYVFPNVSACLSDACPTTLAFARRLLEEEQVALTPGEGFYGAGHVRISYATSLDRLHDGITRLQRFCRRLRG